METEEEEFSTRGIFGGCFVRVRPALCSRIRPKRGSSATAARRCMLGVEMDASSPRSQTLSKTSLEYDVVGAGMTGWSRERESLMMKAKPACRLHLGRKRADVWTSGLLIAKPVSSTAPPALGRPFGKACVGIRRVRSSPEGKSLRQWQPWPRYICLSMDTPTRVQDCNSTAMYVRRGREPSMPPGVSNPRLIEQYSLPRLCESSAFGRREKDDP